MTRSSDKNMLNFDEISLFTINIIHMDALRYVKE